MKHRFFVIEVRYKNNGKLRYKYLDRHDRWSSDVSEATIFGSTYDAFKRLRMFPIGVINIASIREAEIVC